jgi:CheY-like chemotaxis protein/nitrogen-specific signal transduction histidine kinase
MPLKGLEYGWWTPANGEGKQVCHTGSLEIGTQAPDAIRFELGLRRMAEYDEDSVNLALLAHDLRTPLGAMRLTAELIETGPLNDAQAEQLSVLMRAIDSLEQMTTELITDAAPGDAGEDAAVSISSLVHDCADLFRVAAEKKGLKLTVRLQDTAGACQTGAAGQLRRAVSALLDNAIKYTERGGINLEVISCPFPEKQLGSTEQSNASTADAYWVSLSITDTGPGIDPTEREDLFRPFVRGRKAQENTSGSGLGLWGIAQTVRQMGGVLNHSSPETGGSRFEVQIPVKPAAPGLKSTKNASKTGAEDNELPDHVLIVDDNETNCRLLAALLESFGVTSDISHSGEDAIKLALEREYGAVLLDLHMPGMGGLEVAQELRKNRPAEELPLIAVTAALEAFGDDLLRKAGFIEGLGKPLAPSALYDVLVRAQQLKSVHWI